MRKVIQIHPVMADGGLFNSPCLIVYALCDDGTIWARSPWYSDKEKRGWDQVEKVPGT